MNFLIVSGALLGILAIVAGELWITLFRPDLLQGWIRTLARRVLRRLERAPVFANTSRSGAKRTFSMLLNPAGLMAAFSTWPAAIGAIAAISTVALWIEGWVSPQEPRSFFRHFALSAIVGIGLSTAAAFCVHAVGALFALARVRTLSARTGLRGLAVLKVGERDNEVVRKISDGLSSAQQLEVLDFTGYELIAKGSADTGGVLASLVARFPQAEVKILLFNPCAQEADPGRKHSTVIQSQLGALEISRETFESRLRAAVERIDKLNQKRERPIEVRLYSEKPAFSVIVAGPTAFVATTQGRDGPDGCVFEEHTQRTDGASLHGALRSHFQRLWATAAPVVIETAASQPAPELQTA